MAEQRLHAEGARFVGHDRHEPRTEFRVAQQVREQLHEHHGGGFFAVVAALEKLGQRGERRCGKRRTPADPRRQVAAQRLTPGVQVFQLGAVGGGLVETQRGHVRVGQRQIEAVAEGQQRVALQLLLLVRAHLALAPVAHAVAFLGLGQDDGGLALVPHRRVIGGVNFDRIVPAALEPVDVLVGQVGDDGLQLGVLVEKVLAVEPPVGGGVLLQLAVDRLVQPLEDRALVVAGEQRVPVRTPQQLDDVPARAGEQAFQLLDDGTVAAHRTVQALQVAVDHQDEVVQPLAPGQRQAGQRLRFVHLAIADERPHLAPGGGENAAMVQVAHEARLIDGLERAEPHRAGRELPELRHQIRMAVGRQAPAADFPAEMVQLRLAEPPFEEGAGVDAGGGMGLKEHQISRLAGAEKMVEADLEQVRRRGVAGDVAAQFGRELVGPHHHRQRVPAHQSDQPLLGFERSRELGLVGEGDGVAVGGAPHRRQRHAPGAGAVEQLAQQEGGAGAAFVLDDGIERLQPLLGLGRVRVRRQNGPVAGKAEIGTVGHGRNQAAGRVRAFVKDSARPAGLPESSTGEVQLSRRRFRSWR